MHSIMRGNLIWIWYWFVYAKEAMDSIKYNATRTGVYKPFNLACLTSTKDILCPCVTWKKKQKYVSKFNPDDVCFSRWQQFYQNSLEKLYPNGFRLVISTLEILFHIFFSFSWIALGWKFTRAELMVEDFTNPRRWPCNEAGNCSC